MKAKLIYAAALLTVLASASAAGRKEGIEMVYQPQANGDFKLYLFPHGKLLVCEEQRIQLIEPQDPTNEPLVLNCSHGKEAAR
jgi:hypothetical protein